MAQEADWTKVKWEGVPPERECKISGVATK